MELIATKRTELGKKSKKLRKTGKLPAVIFAKGIESIPVTVEALPFGKVFAQAGESSLVDIKLDKETPFKVLISEVAIDPVSDKITHVNFHKVNLKEKISAMVPIHIVGESPIVKSGEGLLLTLIHEVSVEALPADLPHDIKVDVSGLVEVGQSITIKDLTIDASKVEIQGQDADELVVKVDTAKMKEEEVVEEVVDEAALVAKVAASEQLSDEEKAAKEKEKKAEKEKVEKDK